MNLPTPDDLLGLGSFWDGDKGKLPDGKTYWKYMIFAYKDKKTYVLENQVDIKSEKDYTINQVVKRLL